MSKKSSKKKIIKKKERKIIMKESPSPLFPVFWKDIKGIGVALLVVLITFLCFRNATNNQFVNWDDDKNVYENELITTVDEHNFWSNTKKIFSTDVIGNYNPLSIWSFAIEKRLYGLDNSGKWNEDASKFHLTNIMLHLICVFFVFRICLLLGLRWYSAFFVALLFGIHPMRVESVAWITERKDVLYGAFFLSSLYLYIKGKIGKKNYMVWILLLFILSLLSKIQAVALPLSMIAVDYYLSGRLTWKDVISKWPYLLLSLIFGVLGVVVLSGQGSLENAVNYPAWQRIFVGAFSYIVYLVKSLVPYKLSPLYPYPPTMPAYFYPCLLIVPAVLYGLYYSYKKEFKAVFFGLLFFSVNIVFMLQIVGAGQGFLADRFTYIAYLGLFFIFGFYLEKVIETKSTVRYIGAAVAVTMIAVYSFMTVQQNKVWKNSETLWTKVLQYYTKTTLPYGNRANYLRDQGRSREALRDYSEAIRLKPEGDQAYNSRARLYFDLGNTRDTLLLALADYNKAIELSPKDGEFYINRGATYARLGDINNAMRDLDQGLIYKPDHATGYINRSVLYNAQNNLEMAHKDIDSYLALRPFNADIWYEKARALRGMNRLPEAIKAYSQAIKINRGKGIFFYERARTYLAIGQAEKAKSDLQMAINLNYKDIDPLFRQQVGL